MEQRDSRAMAEHHPDAATLHELMFGELADDRRAEVVSHLLPGCKRCADITAALWEEGGSRLQDEPVRKPQAQPSADYDSVIARALRRAGEAARRLDAERSQAEGLFERLIGYPPDRQLLVVHNSRLHRTWGLCERYLREAWNLRFADPRSAEHAARMGVVIALELSPAEYPAAQLEDLRARAWMALANALRVLSDFASSRDAFERAEEHLAAGTGGAFEWATLLELRSSLAISLRDYAEAERMLNQAIARFRRLGQRHDVGRSLIKKAMVRGYLEDFDTSTVLLREGLTLADIGSEPQLVVAAWINLIYYIHQRGDDRQALATLMRARPLCLPLAERTARTRLQWLEGGIALGLGRLEQAEGCLREVRRRFLDDGIAIDAALAALDLADVYARQGRYAEVRNLAAETLAIFRSRQAQAEVIAALVLFRKAAEREQLTATVLAEVATALRRVPAAGSRSRGE